MSSMKRKLPHGTDGHCSNRYLIGLDFDCTLTVRHYWKVFAQCYLKGDMEFHPHAAAFAEWCRARAVPTKMEAVPPGVWAGNAMGAAVEAFSSRGQGPVEDGFRELFREVFCGGEARIQLVADWLQKARNEGGVEFVIVTAGSSSAVLRALAAVPEWRPFFPLPNVWDVTQARHKTGSIMAVKAMMLRDIRPDAARILLVDDSLPRDEPPEWALKVAGVDMFRGGLQYEGSGLDASSLEKIWQAVQAWTAEDSMEPAVKSSKSPVL